MNRNVIGFYHDPPIFLQENPVDSASRTVAFERFNQEVVREKLNADLEMRATVEGLFAFDFSGSSGGSADSSTEPMDKLFAAMAELTLPRTRIMNAYLAFFYTHMFLIDHRNLDRMVVTPELTIPMPALDNDDSQTFGNLRVSHLALSRYPSTYSSSHPYSTDSRITMRGSPISADVVRAAGRDLSALIGAHGDEGVLLADLYLRASKAYEDHNHSLSLIINWTIIERVVNDLWQRMLKDFESHQGGSFITKKRRDILEDGRSFTVSVMTEMLSFLNYIPKDIYDDMSTVRKIRNKWMHALELVDADNAAIATSVCDRLLKQERGLTLIGATVLKLHG